MRTPRNKGIKIRDIWICGIWLWLIYRCCHYLTLRVCSSECWDDFWKM